jgi:putative hydrolase of the HAD superfamily
VKYESILVDLDGVIRKWRPSDEEIEVAFGLPVGSIRKTAFSPELISPAITGAITDEEWREQTAEKLRREFGTSHAREAVAQWTSHPGEADQQVLSLLGARNASVKLVLVTNATSRLPRDLKTLGLLKHFHAIVNSSQVGVKKPSVEIFRIALERSDAVPEHTLFIDDTAANVAAATHLGILSHVFVGHTELSSFLRQAGVLRAEAL